MDATDDPLRVEVLFFALAHELAGTPRTTLELRRPATVGDVDAALRARYAWLGARLATYRIALDEEFVGADAVVGHGAVLAIIPPVSGG